MNFGGYGPAEGGTRMLEGTTSELPGRRNQPNTREFAWQLGHRYRLVIAPAPGAPEGIRAWRGTVDDIDGGGVQVVRDLYTRGEYLHSPMVWSEVFARCEHPSVVVRWSDLRATAASGEELRPQTVRVELPAPRRRRLRQHLGGPRRTGDTPDHRGAARGRPGGGPPGPGA